MSPSEICWFSILKQDNSRPGGLNMVKTRLTREKKHVEQQNNSTGDVCICMRTALSCASSIDDHRCDLVD